MLINSIRDIGKAGSKTTSIAIKAGMVALALLPAGFAYAKTLGKDTLQLSTKPVSSTKNPNKQSGLQKAQEQTKPNLILGDDLQAINPIKGTPLEEKLAVCSIKTMDTGKAFVYKFIDKSSIPPEKDMEDIQEVYMAVFKSDKDKTYDKTVVRHNYRTVVTHSTSVTTSIFSGADEKMTLTQVDKLLKFVPKNNIPYYVLISTKIYTLGNGNEITKQTDTILDSDRVSTGLSSDKYFFTKYFKNDYNGTINEEVPAERFEHVLNYNLQKTHYDLLNEYDDAWKIAKEPPVDAI